MTGPRFHPRRSASAPAPLSPAPTPSPSAPAEDNWWDAPGRDRASAVDAGHLTAANAQNRLGVIWLFSKIEVGEPFDWDQPTRGRSNAVYAPMTTWETAKAQIEGWVRDLVNYIKLKLDAMMRMFDDHGPEIFGAVYIGSLVVATLEELWPAWQDWAPVIGDGAKCAQAIGNTFSTAKTLFDTWITSSCAAIVDGVPSVVVESLRNTMKRSLCTNLYESVSSGLKVAGAFISAGASTVIEKAVGIIAKVVVTIVKKYLTAKEESSMKKFCADAQIFWVKRNDPDSIHLDHKKFVDWYKPVAMAAPCIAAITLLSHICGDKVAYLAMYQDRLASISQSQFDGSVGALDAMKPYAKDYVTESGFDFRTSDRMVRALLNFPMTAPTGLTTTIMSEAEVASITTRARH